MISARRAISLLLATVAVVGCTGTPNTPATGARARGTGSPAPKASPSTAGDLGPNGQMPSTSPSTGASQAPIPSLPPNVATMTLAGRIKAPAHILSNNGAGLISDKGLGIVSNNGGSYRVLQAGATTYEQFYIAGAKVAVVDARGKAVLGPDGQPLVTTTAADGSYGFTSALPEQNVIVQATPPGQAEPLTRLIAKGTRVADVDLSTALVASYVLDQYVRPQADPQATLNKLPADVELETVLRAQAALAGSTLPTSIDPDVLVTTASNLRKSNASLDGQLETVKKILIAAGVSNLGDGLAATDLYFRALQATTMGPDGSLYAYSFADKVIWRILPDGKVSVLAGTGVENFPEKDARDGRVAKDLPLGWIHALRLDGAGRLVVAERSKGIWRIEADGKVKELQSPTAMTNLPDLTAEMYRDDGTLLRVNAGVLESKAPGGSWTTVVPVPGATGTTVIERPEEGRWLVGNHQGLTAYQVGQAPQELWRRSDIVENPAAGDLLAYRKPTFDKYGNLFYENPTAGTLHQLKPDGTDVVIAKTSDMKMAMTRGWQGPDGKIYLLDCRVQDFVGASLVRRLDAPGAAAKVIVGIEGVPKGFASGGFIPLLCPMGLEVAPDGTVFVADAGSLVEIPPTGLPKIRIARGTVLAGQPMQITGVRRMGSGRLVVRAMDDTRELFFRENASGGWDLAYETTEEWVNAENVVTRAWDIAPDGTIYTSFNDADESLYLIGKVLRIPANSTTVEELVPFSAGGGQIGRLVVGAGGKLWMRAVLNPDYTPVRYEIAPNGTLTRLPDNAIIEEATDSSGRAYEGDATAINTKLGDQRIRRRSPGGTPQLFAGAGTSLLGGTSFDDSIGMAEDLRFDAAGNLYLRDIRRRQVRRIPKERL